jgi:hypothetical protein
MPHQALGTTFHVWSAFRLARRARDRGLDLVLATRGPSRADPLATVKLDLDLHDSLAALYPDAMKAP